MIERLADRDSEIVDRRPFDAVDGSARGECRLDLLCVVLGSHHN